MSHKVVISAMAAALIVGSIGWAMAGHHGRHKAGHHGLGLDRNGSHMLQRADQNKDGEITRDELINMRTVKFDKFDADKNGIISEDEIFQTIAKHLKRRAKRILRRHDNNRDGQVTKDEFLAKIDQKIYRLDLNDDGKISKDERPQRHGYRGGYAKRGGRGSHHGGAHMKHRSRHHDQPSNVQREEKLQSPDQMSPDKVK